MSEFYKDVHEDVQRIFPEFNYLQPSPPGMRDVYCDMSHPKNRVGDQQRAFSCFWAMRSCNSLDLGLDLGSTRGLTPYCIHVDRYADGGANPLYVGEVAGRDPVWADVVCDMADLSVFPSGCFPLVMSNHSLEHADVTRLAPEAPPFPAVVGTHEERHKDPRLVAWLAEYSKWRDAYDAGVVRMLREQWVRVLRRPIQRHRMEPGGVLALCVPDGAYFDVFASDPDHKHSWTHDDFRPRVLDKLLDLVEVLEYDTLKNNFSFNVVARRK